jgi:UDP-2,3-diacylglucosamine hydrolase
MRWVIGFMRWLLLEVHYTGPTKLIPEGPEDNPLLLPPGAPPYLVSRPRATLPFAAMSGLPIFLASDVHLGSVPRETGPAFLSWLDYCGAHASQVIVNGDLFDFWFEYGTVIPRGYTRVLGALAALVDAGVPVLLMGGNHDWWGGSYLREEVGVTFHQDPVTLDLPGRRVYLAHGDGMGGGDLGYKLLKLLLRGSPTRFAFRWLHPDVGAWVARRVSKTDARTGEPLEKQIARTRFLEDWATRYLEARPDVDLVALGHTHIPLLKEVFPGRFYLNSGDWLVNMSYGLLEPGEPPRLFAWDFARGLPGPPLSESP